MLARSGAASLLEEREARVQHLTALHNIQANCIQITSGAQVALAGLISQLPALRLEP